MSRLLLILVRTVLPITSLFDTKPSDKKRYFVTPIGNKDARGSSSIHVTPVEFIDVVSELLQAEAHNRKKVAEPEQRRSLRQRMSLN